MSSVITVEQFIKELSSNPKKISFEGHDKRGCALENNIFAFIHFELCSINNNNNKTSGEEEGGKQQQRRFCRISRLELNEGNARSGANQLPRIAAFPLDQDEYVLVPSTSTNTSKDDENKSTSSSLGNNKTKSITETISSQLAEERKKQSTKQENECDNENEDEDEQQQQQQQQQQFALTNIELIGCPTGILIWRPGKQRHFFLRIKDGYLVTLWTENPAVHARVTIEKDPTVENQLYCEEVNTAVPPPSPHLFPTAVHFLTENNLIEGFNLSRVTPTMTALRVFRARLNIPIEAVFPTAEKEEQYLKIQNDASLVSATTASGALSPSRFSTASASSLTSKKTHQQQSANFMSSFVSSTDQHLQHQHQHQQQTGSSSSSSTIPSLHAISFCEVPTHKLLNMRACCFLLQVAEAKEVFAFALPSITAQEEEDFESRNRFHPTESADDFGSNAAENVREGNVLGHIVGRLISVSCHHVPLKEDDFLDSSFDDDDDTKRQRKIKRCGVSIPIKLNSNSNNNNNNNNNLIPSHCSAMHSTIVDVQAGTYCLMLTRRGANAVEFFLFSEHCILRTLSPPKTSSGHHQRLLLDERKTVHQKNEDEDQCDHLASSIAESRLHKQKKQQQNNDNDRDDDDSDDDVDASMFLYDSIPLVSSSAKSTCVRCTVSVANPNFFLLSYSHTNETDRVLNFAICLPVFDRRRKVWTACVASQRKLWKGETIPVLGGDPYPPSPLCCPLPSGYYSSSLSSSSTPNKILPSIGRIQQHLPGSDQLAIFDYEAHGQNNNNNTNHAATTAVSFINWTDLWIATIYSRLDENGATFTATKLDETLSQPLSGETTPLSVSGVNLSEILQIASNHATSVFAQARHGMISTSTSETESSPFVLPRHELALPQLTQLERNDLVKLENKLNQRHSETGKRLGEIILTKIGNLAKNTGEFEKQIETASIESHEEFFRNQGVDVISNTLQQLDETRNMLKTLRIGLEDAAEERKILVEEEDEDHDRSLQELLEKASTPEPAYQSMKSKWIS